MTTDERLTALVTGTSSGFGEVIAKTLARAGASVFKAAGRRPVAASGSQGGEVRYYLAPVLMLGADSWLRCRHI